MLREDFARIFQVPPAMLPYLDLVATAQEMALVVALGDGPLTAEQIAARLGLSPAETGELLTAAYRRHVINRQEGDGTTYYAPATFYLRLDPLAMYENWGDVPADARDAVIQWQLQEFIRTWRPIVEELRGDPDKYVHIPNRDVLLLEEALAMVEAASLHVVVPCDCRAIVLACNRPLETCIRLDGGAELTLERGHGRRLTRDEMKALVVHAHRSGLMHTGDRRWREHGDLFGFCNCCACDCYPFRASRQLDMQRRWPASHYVAERDLDRCEHCGLCVRRCHFGAFYQDGTRTTVNGKNRKTVLFDPARCWGCGLCATTCPDEAIVMRPMEATGIGRGMPNGAPNWAAE